MPTLLSKGRLVPTWPALLAFALVLLTSWGGRVWVNREWSDRANGIFETTAKAIESEFRHRFAEHGAALLSIQRVLQETEDEDILSSARLIDTLHDGMGIPEFLGLALAVPAKGSRSVSSMALEKGVYLDAADLATFAAQLEILEGRSTVSDFLFGEEANVALGAAVSHSLAQEGVTRSAIFWAQRSQSPTPLGFLVVPRTSRENSIANDESLSWLVAAVDFVQSFRTTSEILSRDIALTVRAVSVTGSDGEIVVDEYVDAPKFSKSARINYYGLDFELILNSTPLFEYENLNPIVRFQFFMGIFVSFLIAIVVQMITVRSREVRSVMAAHTRNLGVRERELASIFESALVGIATIDASGRILLLNPEAREILGVETGLTSNLSIRSLLPNIDLKKWHQKLAFPLEAAASDRKMLEIGCTKWDADEGDARLTLILHDITDEYRAQLELAASQKRWDQAMSSSEIGIFDIDVSTGRSVVSTGWLRMMGVVDPPEDFDAQAHFRNYVLKDDLPKVLEADAMVLDGKADRSVSEYRMMIPGIGLRWMRSEAVLVLDEKTGQPLHFSGTQHDITETKLAQDALIASEDRFRSAFEWSPTCNILLDQSFEIVQINRAMRDLLNMTLNLREESPYPEKIFGQHWQRIKEALADLEAKPDAPFRTEIELKRQATRSVWLDISASVIHSHFGEGPAFFLQIIDSSKLRLVDQVKSEFIATVSHELRTPVTSIRGAVDLLNALPTQSRSTGERRLFEILARNASRLTELISEILDLEAMQTGQIQLVKDDLSVAELIHEVEEAFLPVSERYSVSIHVDHIDPAAVIFVDHRRAYQCLGNLVSNACKYSAPNETIRIRSEAITSSQHRIEVINKGTSIPTEFESMLFNAFARVDTSDTRNSGGTGLGLKITKELMEKMDGNVTYRRGAQGETIFSLDFAVRPKPSP